MYDLARGLHILAVIAWMAGLLYLPRIYVYYVRPQSTEAVRETLGLMAHKLLKLIMNPSMIIAWLLGLWLIHLNVSARGIDYLWQGFMIIKLFGVIFLTSYHMFLALRLKKLKKGEDIGSEKLWRYVNEVPAVLAIIIVLAVTTEFIF